MSSAPREIHIASAGYVRRFGVDKHVVVRDVATGREERRGARKAAYRRDWWGTDPELAAAIEKSLNQCESPALRDLGKIDKLWPLSSAHRVLVGQFIAIHVVRTPAFGIFLRMVTEQSIEDESVRAHVPAEHLHLAAELFRGERMHANALLGQITRLASLLCGMQWSLVRFDGDLLATSDQPVVALPLVPRGVHAAGNAVPPNGWMDVIEVRFSLDPRTLLLMSWSDAPDAPAPLPGTFNQACTVNCGVITQADREWFYRPGPRPCHLTPASLQPLVYPISPQLLPGYNAAVASGSSRRRAADQLMAEMIRDNTPRDQMRWVTVRNAEQAA